MMVCMVTYSRTSKNLIMRKYFLLFMLIPLILCCSKNNQVVIEEEIEIGFIPSKVEVIETPMVKASNNSSDLYGLQIYQVPMEGKDERFESQVCWVTDNLAKSTISLKKNKKYVCYLVYVPNGKNILYNSGKNYGTPFFHLGPFSSPEFDIIHYGSYYDMNFAAYGATMTKDKTDYRTQANVWNQVEIYYGMKYITTTEAQTVSIDLYKMMFGLNIKATNFSSGKLAVYSCGGGNDSYQGVVENDGYVYMITPQNPEMEEVIELLWQPWGRCDLTEDDIKSWGCNDILAIDYISDSGRIINLVKQDIHTQRMTKYTINLNVGDLIEEIDNTINPNVIKDEWDEVQGPNI